MSDIDFSPDIFVFGDDLAHLQVVWARKANFFADAVLYMSESYDAGDTWSAPQEYQSTGQRDVGHTFAFRYSPEGNSALITREIDGGSETIETTYPFVTSGQKGIAKEPRIPGMRGIMQARKKPLAVVPAVEQENYTTVVSHDLPEAKGSCKMVSADNPAELVRLLHEEAKAI